MKILLAAHAFSPAIGGIESCSLTLAREFSNSGHEVQILTQTPSRNLDEDCDLKVFRQPSKAALCRALQWCDVYFQNNISLQTAWPLIFIHKPWVVTTQTWLQAPDGREGRNDRFKRKALLRAKNIAISQAVADHLGIPSKIIPNPYDENIFRRISGMEKTGDLIFVGRLVSDKGVHVLLQALSQLKAGSGLEPKLSIVGQGPEEAALKKLRAELGLGNVAFLGAKQGEDLAAELNRHHILVAPSLWKEPFGIVAVEGIACGCAVIGSQEGGLREAIGNCGVTFANGDANALANRIAELINSPARVKELQSLAASHLRNFTAASVAQRYLEVFQDVLR